MNINEATRKELIDKSKSADKTKSYGTTRYERRSKQKVLNSIAIYNMIDMNALFKASVLSFIVPIEGETDDYSVKVVFSGICETIKDELRHNNNELEYKCIYRAIVNSINKQDIRVSCDCEDFKYRFGYVATQNNYNSGMPENRPSDITNPNDTEGAGCKHILKSLDNLDWALKLATSIYNYIKYMEDEYPDKFERIIFPKIYSISWDSYQQAKNQSEDEIKEPDTESGAEPDIEPEPEEETEVEDPEEADYEEPEDNIE